MVKASNPSWPDTTEDMKGEFRSTHDRDFTKLNPKDRDKIKEN